jgi:hypothetical protein
MLQTAAVAVVLLLITRTKKAMHCEAIWDKVSVYFLWSRSHEHHTDDHHHHDAKIKTFCRNSFAVFVSFVNFVRVFMRKIQFLFCVIVCGC